MQKLLVFLYPVEGALERYEGPVETEDIAGQLVASCVYATTEKMKET